MRVSEHDVHQELLRKVHQRLPGLSRIEAGAGVRIDEHLAKGRASRGIGVDVLDLVVGVKIEPSVRAARYQAVDGVLLQKWNLCSVVKR